MFDSNTSSSFSSCFVFGRIESCVSQTSEAGRVVIEGNLISDLFCLCLLQTSNGGTLTLLLLSGQSPVFSGPFLPVWILLSVSIVLLDAVRLAAAAVNLKT